MIAARARARLRWRLACSLLGERAAWLLYRDASDAYLGIAAIGAGHAREARG